ncbi:CSF3R factor, partial [Nothoprocta ornata]|nr:CSF3R factor [Nothoprocta ornata]
MARLGAGPSLLHLLLLLLLLSVHGEWALSLPQPCAGTPGGLPMMSHAPLPTGGQGCASLSVDSPIVPLGSAVSASCAVRAERCGGLQRAQIRIAWLLDSEPLAGRQQRGPAGTELSNLTLPHFNRSQARLWCLLQWNGTRQRVAMAELRAGYPPAKPSNLSCMLNLSDYGLTCQWARGADSLPTSVALKCATSRAQREAGAALTGCSPRDGRHHCTVPRRLLHLYRHMEIWVSARNALGTAESERLRIDPMDVAKLEPPALQSIEPLPGQPDCVSVGWRAARSSAHMELQCELRYRSPEEPAWALVPNISEAAQPALRLCGFLCGTRYSFQLRCRRPSPSAYWSEWSPGKEVTTQEKAPAARLDAWWSTRRVGAGRRVEVQLRWKAPSWREANGRLRGYRVALSPRQRGRGPLTVCDTSDTQCGFSAPAGTARVYLTAYNAAGESAATEVVLLEQTGQALSGLRAVPSGERSLRVQWERPPGAVAGYVVEWQRVPAEPARCSACWQRQRGAGATSALIRDGIEPFQRYNVSVFPLYEDAVGAPAHIAAYSKQKAPSRAPKLHLKSISKSQAELCWDSIPVELQNGFITSYTIFWANSTADVSSALVPPSHSSFVVGDLKPSTLYKVHIMASTAAGGTNGTSLILVTTVLDDIEIQFLFLSLALIFILLVLLMICFQKNGRVKKQLWPSVPDPAHSSLGSWVPTELHRPPQVPGTREPGPATISAVTVLERAPGKAVEAPSADPERAQGYVQQPGVRAAEPVQYVQVLGDDPWAGPARRPRGSSPRRPLLPYQNVWPARRAEPASLREPLLHFPLLQGLRLGGADELHDCQQL